jgi:hypothetical protein
LLGAPQAQVKKRPVAAGAMQVLENDTRGSSTKKLPNIIMLAKNSNQDDFSIRVNAV